MCAKIKYKIADEDMWRSDASDAEKLAKPISTVSATCACMCACVYVCARVRVWVCVYARACAPCCPTDSAVVCMALEQAFLKQA